MIDQILTYNARFVANKEYEPYVTDKFPAKKLAVLTCMDTRLTELLPKALGLRNGDAKIIKNAGGLVLSETDSAIRSLLVGIYELGVQEVMVVHHSTCGACHMSYATASSSRTCWSAASPPKRSRNGSPKASPTGSKASTTRKPLSARLSMRS